MHLLRRCDSGAFSLIQCSDNAPPPYAILSHTWGADAEEVTFKDLINDMGRNKAGYKKIQFCGEQAERDNLEHFWIDTCCINKEIKAELSQAINSMFRWYQTAVKCYVYLPDVSVSDPSWKESNTAAEFPWESAFRHSRWFTRGWTLQELLAPSSVEFFSQEGKRLGDKGSLRRQIHEITGIPDLALQGAPLSQFSVNQRLSWKETRQTKLEEDSAYSLLGILGVYIAPIYGEGIGAAFKRLLDEVNKLEKCLQDLHLTDPRDDRKRIEDTKGGLLKDSYYWVLQSPSFQQWYNIPRSQLLWIKGDPGKGKTMLLCGIIEELKKSIEKMETLSYFFCQATDSRINNATAVLRGLLYLLINHQPLLVSHIRKKHDHAGEALFKDNNAWVALSEIFADIVQDPRLNNAYFIIDALDECVEDLPKLLDFIVKISSLSSPSSRVKWIISSRNEAHIEQRLRLNNSGTRLSLELKENAAQVSHAVNTYIDHCLSELTVFQYDMPLQELVREKMQQKANGTFLWVSLVVKELKDVMSWEVLQVLEEIPMELKDVYRRMMKQIRQLQRQYPELCRQILSTVILAYRPLHLRELYVLSGLPMQTQNEEQMTIQIVKMCGSFLKIREGNVYIIHQSATDFLSDEASPEIFPCGAGEIHQSILSRSLQVMSRELRRDIYNLGTKGCSIEQVVQPDPDPLVSSRYSCMHWIDHLERSSTIKVDLQDGGTVDDFLRKQYLYWLEALSLCKSMTKGVVSLAKLDALVQKRENTSELNELVRDAHRFILSHKSVIEKSPLQVYISALLFSPTRSLIRSIYKEEEPSGIAINPAMQNTWSPCLQTLEGHKTCVNSVAFSHDSARLASASDDLTVKIWDSSNGECLQTLTGHSRYVKSVTFSHDSKRLASWSDDDTVRIWDSGSGECHKTFTGYLGDGYVAVFSHDLSRLASIVGENTVQIWDIDSGECLRMRECHRCLVVSLAFSYDSARVASVSIDGTVAIWDTCSAERLLRLKDHSNLDYTLAFSHDSTRLASASGDGIIKIWEAGSGKRLQIMEGHSSHIESVAFSYDTRRLASGSFDLTVRIWDTRSGECLQILIGHRACINSVAFSHDSRILASVSNDRTIRMWDVSSSEYSQTLQDYGRQVRLVTFSHDSARFISIANELAIRIWDVDSVKCLQILRGHTSHITTATFSYDSTRLASASCDDTIRIWDVSSGECLQVLKYCAKLTALVVFSYDSRRLASVSAFTFEICTVEIWDVRNSNRLMTLEGHDHCIDSIVFSHDSARLASTDRYNLRIWDTCSGECLGVLAICNPLGRISFDITNSYLHSDLGTIDISVLSGSVTHLPILAPCPVKPKGLALSSDRVWVTYNSEKLIWLPLEFRPSCYAVSGRKLCIGVASGRVWTCHVQPDACI